MWVPNKLRCLIVGESPGEDAEKYFYNERRRVAVRTLMLRGLHRHGLITEPNLVAFRKAGFLFDHAIRCLLDSDIIRHEAALAQQYASSRAGAAAHLDAFLGAESAVWVMGRIARNGVANPRSEFPRDTSEISKAPNPRWLPDAPRFFVSRYLLHASRADAEKIFARLHPGLKQGAASQCVACQGTS
jgi:hypothetical protein